MSSANAADDTSFESGQTFPPLMATLDTYVDTASDARFHHIIHKVRTGQKKRMKKNGKKGGKGSPGKSPTVSIQTQETGFLVRPESRVPDQPSPRIFNSGIDGDMHITRRQDGSLEEGETGRDILGFDSESLETSLEGASANKSSMSYSSPPKKSKKSQSSQFSPRSPARIVVQPIQDYQSATLPQQQLPVAGSRQGNVNKLTGTINKLTSTASPPRQQHQQHLYGKIKSDLGFSNAVESIAAIKLHNYAIQRRDHVTQKLKLLREIREFQRDGDKELIESSKVRTARTLGAWKIRYAVEAVRFKTMRTVAENLERQKMDLEADCAQQQQVYSELEVEKEQMERRLYGEIEQLKDRNREVQQARDQARNENGSLQFDLRSAEKQLQLSDDDLKLAKTDIERLQESLAAEQERANQLENELRVTQRTCGELVRTSAEKDNKMVDMEKEVVQLRAIHQEEVRELNLAREVHREELELALIREEDNEVRYMKIAALRDVLEEKTEQVKSLEAHVVSLQAETVSSQEQVQQTEKRLLEKENELADVAHEKSGLQHLTTELAKKLSIAEESNINLGVVEKQLKVDVQTAQDEIEDLRKRNDILDEELGGAQAAVEFLGEENVELAREIECHHMHGEEMQTKFNSTYQVAEHQVEYSSFLEEELFEARKMYQKLPPDYNSATQGGSGDSNGATFHDVSEESYAYHHNHQQQGQGQGQGQPRKQKRQRKGKAANPSQETAADTEKPAEGGDMGYDDDFEFEGNEVAAVHSKYVLPSSPTNSEIESLTGIEAVTPMVLHLNSYSRGASRQSVSRGGGSGGVFRGVDGDLGIDAYMNYQTTLNNNSSASEQRLAAVLGQLEEKMKKVDLAADSLRFLAERAGASGGDSGAGLVTTGPPQQTRSSQASFHQRSLSPGGSTTAPATPGNDAKMDKQTWIDQHLAMERLFADLQAEHDAVSVSLMDQQVEIQQLQSQKCDCKNAMSSVKKQIRRQSRKLSMKATELFSEKGQGGDYVADGVEMEDSSRSGGSPKPQRSGSARDVEMALQEKDAEVNELSVELENLKDKLTACKANNTALNSKSISVQTQMYHLDQKLEKSSKQFLEQFGESITGYYPEELAHLLEHSSAAVTAVDNSTGQGRLDIEHGHVSLPSSAPIPEGEEGDEEEEVGDDEEEVMVEEREVNGDEEDGEEDGDSSREDTYSRRKKYARKRSSKSPKKSSRNSSRKVRSSKRIGSTKGTAAAVSSGSLESVADSELVPGAIFDEGNDSIASTSITRMQGLETGTVSVGVEPDNDAIGNTSDKDSTTTMSIHQTTAAAVAAAAEAVIVAAAQMEAAGGKREGEEEEEGRGGNDMNDGGGGASPPGEPSQKLVDQFEMSKVSPAREKVPPHEQAPFQQLPVLGESNSSPGKQIEGEDIVAREEDPHASYAMHVDSEVLHRKVEGSDMVDEDRHRRHEYGQPRKSSVDQNTLSVPLSNPDTTTTELSADVVASRTRRSTALSFLQDISQNVSPFGIELGADDEKAAAMVETTTNDDSVAPNVPATSPVAVVAASAPISAGINGKQDLLSQSVTVGTTPTHKSGLLEKDASSSGAGKHSTASSSSPLFWRGGQNLTSHTHIDRKQQRQLLQQAREHLISQRSDLQQCISNFEGVVEEIRYLETSRATVRAEIALWLVNFMELCGYPAEHSDKMRSSKMQSLLQDFEALQEELVLAYAKAETLSSTAQRARQLVLQAELDLAAATATTDGDRTSGAAPFSEPSVIERQVFARYPIPLLRAYRPEDPQQITAEDAEHTVAAAAASEKGTSEDVVVLIGTGMGNIGGGLVPADGATAAATSAVGHLPVSSSASSTTPLTPAQFGHSTAVVASQGADESSSAVLNLTTTTGAEGAEFFSNAETFMGGAFANTPLHPSNDDDENQGGERSIREKKDKKQRKDKKKAHHHKSSASKRRSGAVDDEDSGDAADDDSKQVQSRISSEGAQGFDSEMDDESSLGNSSLSAAYSMKIPKNMKWDGLDKEKMHQIEDSLPKVVSNDRSQDKTHHQDLQKNISENDEENDAAKINPLSAEEIRVVQEEFDALKKELRRWNKQYAKEHGRRPTPDDFQHFDEDVKEAMFRKKQLQQFLDDVGAGGGGGDSGTTTGVGERPATSASSVSNPDPSWDLATHAPASSVVREQDQLLVPVEAQQGAAASTPLPLLPVVAAMVEGGEKAEEEDHAAPSTGSAGEESDALSVPTTPYNDKLRKRLKGKSAPPNGDDIYTRVDPTGASSSSSSSSSTVLQSKYSPLINQHSVNLENFLLADVSSAARSIAVDMDVNPESLIAELQVLRKDLRRWNADFLQSHGRKPSVEDFEDFDDAIKDKLLRKNQIKLMLEERNNPQILVSPAGTVDGAPTALNNQDIVATSCNPTSVAGAAEAAAVVGDDGAGPGRGEEVAVSETVEGRHRRAIAPVMRKKKKNALEEAEAPPVDIHRRNADVHADAAFSVPTTPFTQKLTGGLGLDGVDAIGTADDQADSTAATGTAAALITPTGRGKITLSYSAELPNSKSELLEELDHLKLELRTWSAAFTREHKHRPSPDDYELFGPEVKMQLFLKSRIKEKLAQLEQQDQQQEQYEQEQEQQEQEEVPSSVPSVELDSAYSATAGAAVGAAVDKLLKRSPKKSSKKNKQNGFADVVLAAQALAAEHAEHDDSTYTRSDVRKEYNKLKKLVKKWQKEFKSAQGREADEDEYDEPMAALVARRAQLKRIYSELADIAGADADNEEEEEEEEEREDKILEGGGGSTAETRHLHPNDSAAVGAPDAAVGDKLQMLLQGVGTPALAASATSTSFVNNEDQQQDDSSPIAPLRGDAVDNNSSSSGGGVVVSGNGGDGSRSGVLAVDTPATPTPAALTAMRPQSSSASSTASRTPSRGGLRQNTPGGGGMGSKRVSFNFISGVEDDDSNNNSNGNESGSAVDTALGAGSKSVVDAASSDNESGAGDSGDSGVEDEAAAAGAAPIGTPLSETAAEVEGTSFSYSGPDKEALVEEYAKLKKTLKKWQKKFAKENGRDPTTDDFDGLGKEMKLKIERKFELKELLGDDAPTSKKIRQKN